MMTRFDWQSLIALALVAWAAWWLVRALYRATRSGKTGCGTCGTCPAQTGSRPLVQLEVTGPSADQGRGGN